MSEVWNVNQALRESNQKLELEVAALRQAVGVRRLTSASSAGGRSVGEGGYSARSSTTGGASQQALQLAGLEQQLREVQRAAVAEREAAADRLQAALEGARAEAAVAQAGIAELSQRLRMAQDEAEHLRGQLAASQGMLAAQQVELSTQQAQLAGVAEEAEGRRAQALALQEQLAAAQAAQAQQAGAAAARVIALEKQVAALLLEPPQAPSDTSRPASPADYIATHQHQHQQHQQQGPLPHLFSPSHRHVTRVYNVVLPAAGEAEAAQERHALQQQVAGLRDCLAEMEAELGGQLAAKQQVQLQLAAAQAELAKLCEERDLLQEQAMNLQQEVSAFQQGSLLRGGASGAELAQEQTLERSPSRTLACRMHELLSGSPRRGGGGGSSGDNGASRSGSSQSLRSPRGAGSSRPASPRRAMPALAEASAESAPTSSSCEQDAAKRELELELQRRLQQVEVQLQQQTEAAAEAGAKLARAQEQHEASLEAVRGRMAAAEAAAESVLRLQGARVDLRSAAAASAGVAPGSSHQQCREAIEGIYAQMWRERLGRQKAQAEAVDLRIKLSGHHMAAAAGPTGSQGGAAAGGAGAGGAAVTAAVAAAAVAADVDDAVMESLQREMWRADHLAEELQRQKAHQVKLERRAERLALQLAQYTSLLSAAEGVGQLPRLGSGSPGSAGRRAGGGGGGGSPVQAAIAALQARKAAEEAAALREQLRAALADVASVRRRERETTASLKAAQAGRRALEEQQAALASGLHTLQRLLAKKGGSGSGSGSGTISASRGREGSSRPMDGAMAALSALLGSLQSEEVAGSQMVVSAQLSMGVGTLGDAAGPAEEAGAAGEQSDPVDITTLLPEGPDESIDNRVESSAAVLAAPGSCLAPLAAPPKGSSCTAAASPGRLATGGRTSSSASQEAVPGSIAAVQLQKQGVAVVALRASPSSSTTSSSLSRIPAAPPPAKAGARTPQSASPAGGSPGKGRLRKLVLGLQASCGRHGPGSTLSSGREAAASPVSPGSSAPASPARRVWSPARKA